MSYVAGFGTLSSTYFTIRKPGDSYTCSEGRASLNVVNDERTNLAFVQIDGGYFADGDSCDFSVSQAVENPTGFLLELKGRHILHGINQLRTTLARLKTAGVKVRYRKAIIVSSGAGKIPGGDWMKKQKKFHSQTGVLLSKLGSNTSIAFSYVVA